ncbi:MAG TPA: hydroxysqualene dehydroxylase HpnE [Stellaceae bacterium]|nr:hydroxysqualene dehydroxylase HpnE [Stellaceae bacterium]
MSQVHIIGAGLAGLSAAVRLAAAGRKVSLWEAGPQAGGRCRSYFDEALGCRIDNGNHLLLSGNVAALDYLRLIGSADTLVGPAQPLFPFMDLATGERWTIALDRGRLPFWLFDPARRVPGTRPFDYLGALRLAVAGPEATVDRVLGGAAVLYRRFWQPLAVSVLNTEAEAGAAALLWPVLRQTFGRGGAFCLPLVARDGLSESWVDPALDFLAARGGSMRTGMRGRRLGYTDGRVSELEIGGTTLPVAADDTVILAVPPTVAADLVPGLVAPTEFRPIVNAHFRLRDADSYDAGAVRIIGLVGGTAEWVFHRGPLASVTISAANTLVDLDAEAIAARLWPEVATALGLVPQAMPAYRIVKEKRATFAQTPAQIRRRPPVRTAWRNLYLAGDWTNTGLPATIEGTIRSGASAASCVLENP